MYAVKVINFTISCSSLLAASSEYAELELRIQNLQLELEIRVQKLQPELELRILYTACFISP